MAEPQAFRCETREELVSFLSEAAELEHGLCCSYLFAAFSLKSGPAAGLSEQQADAVGRWREHITDVAKEEMLHLALVSNLLTALGAAPHMGRPPFPQQSAYYPAGITIALRRFDEATADEPYQVVNVGTGTGTTVRELVAAFQAVVGGGLEVREGPARPGDVAGCFTRSDKAVRLLGWRAEKSVEDGVRDALAWAGRRDAVLVG